MKKFLVILAAVLGLTLGMQSTSHALTMWFSDNISPAFSVVDGDGNDSNGAIGAVTYIGGIGTWTVNVTTGLSYPILGSATSPMLDLNSVNVTSTSGGHLTVYLIENDFVAPVNGGIAGPFNLAAGGTTTGTVQVSIFGKDGNGEGLGNATLLNWAPIAGLGVFSGPAFSGTTSGTFSATQPFSLGIQADIIHEGHGSSSFDAALSVPEPTTMLLFGLGLLGLAGLRRRFKK